MEEAGIIGIVAENVRRLRKAAALSQEELAHEAGVDRTYVSQVERGKRNLTVTVLARLAQALKTTPDRLLVAQVSERSSTSTEWRHRGGS